MDVLTEDFLYEGEIDRRRGGLFDRSHIYRRLPPRKFIGRERY
jgi:hypothetical protein